MEGKGELGSKETRTEGEEIVGSWNTSDAALF